MTSCAPCALENPPGRSSTFSRCGALAPCRVWRLLTFPLLGQLVPVQYRRLNGKVFDSHQYSVTEYFTSSKVCVLETDPLEGVASDARGAGE